MPSEIPGEKTGSIWATFDKTNLASSCTKINEAI